MRGGRTVVVAAILAGTVLVCHDATAAELYLEFVRALQQRGYVDTALSYLESLDNRADVPAEIRDVLELERCQTYVLWAEAASSAELARQRYDLAQASLDKFSARHPVDPRVATAMLRWGDSCLERGRQYLARLDRGQNEAARLASLQEARAVLDDAHTRLEKVEELFAAWLAGSAAAAQAASPDNQQVKPPRPPEEAERGIVEARFKIALSLYYLAQTYEDADNDRRDELLRDAAQRFDKLYQDLRNTVSDACLFAHLWHARALAELQDYETAQDIFDEVLASEPDDGQGECELAPLYAQTRLFQFQSRVKQSDPAESIKQARAWLESHRGWQALAGYQGLTLEVARTLVAMARKATRAKQLALLRLAAKLLEGAGQVDSEYRKESILLQSDVLKELGAQDLSIDQLLALGDADTAARQFAEAAEVYSRASQLATEQGDTKSADEGNRRRNHVLYLQAGELFATGKYEEVLALIGPIAREGPKEPSASQAALLGLWSAQRLCIGAQDGAAAAARVEKIADFIVQNWQGSPEADKARIAMARTRFLQGNHAAALDRLREVGPDSAECATAQYIAGQIHWRAYLDENKKDETTRNQPQLKLSLDNARESLQKSLQLFENGLATNGSESGLHVADVRTLLAEVLLEGQDFGPAAALLEPMVAAIQTRQPARMDPADFRALVAAVRAYLGLDEIARACEIAPLLGLVAEDRAETNKILVNVARLLGREFARAAAAANAPPGSAPPPDKAAAQRETIREALRGFLPALIARREQSVADRVRLAELCMQTGLADAAGEQYQLALQAIGTDEGVPPEARSAVTRARPQFIDLLRKQGKFAEAVKLSDELIKEQPRVLEPRLTRARMLEAWARQDPTQYDTAVAAWTEIRTLVGRLPQRPLVFYEAIYQSASCLYEQGRATKDLTKLLQAEQILKATRIQNSKLSGPEMVAQYEELLKRIASAQPAGNGKTTPAAPKTP